MNEKNEPIAPSRRGRVLYWLRVALELLIPLLLLIPPVWALIDPRNDLFTQEFLFIELGACLAGMVLAGLAAKLTKRATRPKGRVTTRALLRSFNADNGLARLMIGLFGTAFLCFGTVFMLDDIPFMFWFFLPFALLGFYMAFSTVRKEQDAAGRIIRGKFTLVLAEVTETERKTVERNDYGSDGTGYSYSYEYYLYFAEARTPASLSHRVSRSEYDGAYSGKRYYLLVLNQSIASVFPEDGCTLDPELQKHLRVEILTPEEKKAAEERRQAVEAEILKSVPGAAAPGEVYRYDMAWREPEEGRTSVPTEGLRRAETFRQKFYRILTGVSLGLAALFVLLVLLFNRDAAVMLLPLALLPLLLLLIPLTDRLQKQYAGVPADPAMPRLMTARTFRLDKVLPLGMGGAALLGAFLLVFLAAFFWIREEDGGFALWGPVGFLLVVCLAIPGLTLTLIAWSRYGKRKRAVEKRELVILELPLLRKESSVSSGDCTLYFPDIDRGPGMRLYDGTASTLHFMNGPVTANKGRLEVRVNAFDFRMANPGDRYYLFFLDDPRTKEELVTCCRWEQVRLDADLQSRVMDLEEYQARYDALRKK